MNNKKPLFLKSEKNESIILTPKTPMKTKPNKHFKILKIENILQKNIKNDRKDLDNEANRFEIISDDIIDCFNDSKCMIYEENDKQTKKSSNILQNRYVIVNKIGSGDFCDVYLAIKKNSKDGDNASNSNSYSFNSNFENAINNIDCNQNFIGDGSNNYSLIDNYDNATNNTDCNYVNNGYNSCKQHNSINNNVCQEQHKKNGNVNECGTNSICNSVKINETDNNTKYVCIKKNQKAFKGDVDRKNKLKEVKIMKMIQSRNILKINYVFEENKYLYIETEFCEFGTLKNLIHRIYFEKKIKFEKLLIYKLMKEIANGLKVMHKNKIVHSDLKPENIYIQKRIRIGSCVDEIDAVKRSNLIEDCIRCNNVNDRNNVTESNNINQSNNDTNISNINYGDVSKHCTSNINTIINEANTNNIDCAKCDTHKKIYCNSSNHSNLNFSIDNSSYSIENLCINGFYDAFIFKIGDFNISRFTKDEIDEDGDKQYMGPEILLNKNTTASDIFSLGLIYLELLTGIVLPTKGSEWMKLRNNNLRSVKNIDKQDKIILLKMIDKNYNKRIKAKDVYKYFSNEMKKIV